MRHHRGRVRGGGSGLACGRGEGRPSARIIARGHGRTPENAGEVDLGGERGRGSSSRSRGRTGSSGPLLLVREGGIVSERFKLQATCWELIRATLPFNFQLVHRWDSNGTAPMIGKMTRHCIEERLQLDKELKRAWQPVQDISKRSNDRW